MTGHMADSETVNPKNTRIEAREAIFKLEDGSTITGKINLLAEPATKNSEIFDKHGAGLGPFYRRISDLFTSGKNPFIVVFDATLGGFDKRVLIINKSKILWVSPND